MYTYKDLIKPDTYIVIDNEEDLYTLLNYLETDKCVGRVQHYYNNNINFPVGINLNKDGKYSHSISIYLKNKFTRIPFKEIDLNSFKSFNKTILIKGQL